MAAARSRPARSRASGDTIRVEGHQQLDRALRQIDPVLQKNLRKRLRVIGKQVVAVVRGKMPRRTGAARRSVRTGVTGKGAYVALGKSSVAPHAAWLDFGGVLRPSGGRRNTQRRPAIKEGRYLYPAIREMAPETRRQAVEAFAETKRELGLK